ncbi:MAG: hypothetical protein ACI82A_003470 [Candidatus Azotimanducaceae bacterium]|jgi:hypothetical protein
MTTTQIQRSATMLAPPIKLDPAFSHADAVINLIHQGAPYKSITAVHKDPANDNTPGWFRNFWALGGKVIFDGADDAFHNPNFIAAAKQSFDAKVIQPLTMMTNLNVPAAASPRHLDLPFFRGAHAREVPSWILAPMGYSGLFQEWAIPVASAITWFYDGAGGNFEYWPDGQNLPSHSVSPPYTNTSVLADNEYMYHRVGPMGDEADYLDEGISSDALLHKTNSGWEIRLGSDLIKAYRHDQIRTSILWKAFCFKNQQAADLFADTSHNLTPGQVVDIFCADLTRRGIVFTEPTDLETDQSWMNTVNQHYSPAPSR